MILGLGCLATCGGLWRPVAGCGGLWQQPLAPIYYHPEALGLVGWLDGLMAEWLAGWMAGWRWWASHLQPSTLGA